MFFLTFVNLIISNTFTSATTYIIPLLLLLDSTKVIFYLHPAALCFFISMYLHTNLELPKKGCQGRRNQALHLRPPFHRQELPRPDPQPQPSDGPVWPVQTATRCFPHEPQVHSTFIFTFTIPLLSILLVPNLGALNSTRGLQSFLVIQFCEKHKMKL